jgi:hypothetical protein
MMPGVRPLRMNVQADLMTHSVQVTDLLTDGSDVRIRQRFTDPRKLHRLNERYKPDSVALEDLRELCCWFQNQILERPMPIAIKFVVNGKNDFRHWTLATPRAPYEPIDQLAFSAIWLFAFPTWRTFQPAARAAHIIDLLA